MKTTGTEQLDNVNRQVQLNLQKCINHRMMAALGERYEGFEEKPEHRIKGSLELVFKTKVSIVPNMPCKDGKLRVN